jgi:hypothetical protein
MSNYDYRRLVYVFVYSGFTSYNGEGHKILAVVGYRRDDKVVELKFGIEIGGGWRDFKVKVSVLSPGNARSTLISLARVDLVYCMDTVVGM